MASNQDQTDYAIRNETANHLNNNSNSNNVIKRSVNAGNNEAALNESVPDVENKSSKQPKNTALKQQRLPAWQPVLTAKTVFPLFFGVGVVFIVLGAVLLSYSNLVNEQIIDYTNCLSPNGTACSAYSNSTSDCACICTLNFSLSADFTAPVYLYYGLKNFYQNHRRYVKSRDDSQLLGTPITSASSLNSECAPYDQNNMSMVYAPCGAIANSLFNDTFTLTYMDQFAVVPVLKSGIAWTTDYNVKFNNPTNNNWDNTVMPKNWHYNASVLGGYKNEDLIVWMRTAALPSFRKFYRRVDHTQSNLTQFSNKLPQGNYNVSICYNYPVTIFGGSKLFIISTTTWIGGKNPFLGIAYLVVGCTCIVLGCVFLIIHFKFSRNSKSMDEFSNRTNIATVELPNRES